MRALAILIVTVFCVGAAQAQTQTQTQTIDRFRNDPIEYFGSKNMSGWVGSGSYFQTMYTDTLVFSADSTGKGLTIRRVLVNADKGAAISRGKGHIIPVPGDSVYAVLWTERSYPPVNGVMRWEEGQWVISFDGDWKEWSIRVSQNEPGALIAAAARNVPGMGPIELTAMKYRMITR